jgi:hypothetical protein
VRSPTDLDSHVGGAEIVIRPDDPPGPRLDSTLAELACTTRIAARDLDVDVVAMFGESTALTQALDRLALTERIQEYVRDRSLDVATLAPRRARDAGPTPRRLLAPRRRSNRGGGRPPVRRSAHAPPGSDSSGEDGPGEPGAGDHRHHDVDQSCRAVVV